jgi:hypothetical protein
MTPIPSHLKKILLQQHTSSDGKSLTATVKCGCGNPNFKILYPGQNRVFRGTLGPGIARSDGHSFLLIKAQCTACNGEHVLFDKDLHGWNAIVNPNRAQAALPRPALVPWPCQRCGHEAHEIGLTIASEGKEEFEEQTEGKLKSSLWVDAFSWFEMDTKCAHCKKKTPRFLDYDAM